MLVGYCFHMNKHWGRIINHDATVYVHTSLVLSCTVEVSYPDLVARLVTESVVAKHSHLAFTSSSFRVHLCSGSEQVTSNIQPKAVVLFYNVEWSLFTC